MHIQPRTQKIGSPAREPIAIHRPPLRPEPLLIGPPGRVHKRLLPENLVVLAEPIFIGIALAPALLFTSVA